MEDRLNTSGDNYSASSGVNVRFRRWCRPTANTLNA